MTRFGLAAACIVAALLAACAPSEPGPVIIVDIDTLRADHLGVYGYDRPTSPNLDAFSQDAVRFAWAFAQGPNTPPSQASILTGLYPPTHGRIADDQVVPESADSLAESFATAGWSTGAFVDGGLMARGFGLEQGFDVYNDEAGGIENVWPRALAWMDQRLGAGEKQFFLLIHCYDVHTPYEVTPEPHRSFFLDGLESPSDAVAESPARAMKAVHATRHDEHPRRFDAIDLAWLVALYDGGIRHVDHWFGRFLDALEQRRLLDSATIVVLSDHGDAFQEHGTLLHDRIYAPVTHVPLIVKKPFAGSHGQVIDAVVELIDVAPTLLALHDLPVPIMMQGENLLPVIRGESEGRGVAFSHSRHWGKKVAVANRRLRAIHGLAADDIELYDYRVDPDEQIDLAASLPAERDRMRDVAKAWLREVREERLDGTGKRQESLSSELIEQLRALGYVD